jgi:hypothetical protein
MPDVPEQPKAKPAPLAAAPLAAAPPVLGKPALSRFSPEQAAEFVEQKLRPRFEGGEPRALLDAVDICARAGIAMPWWLVEAFSARYTAWRRLQIKTLDETFQVAWPKGTRWSDLARRERLKSDVLHRAFELRTRENLPFGEELFECIGRDLGISGGLANKIFYAPENKDDREYVSAYYGVADT